MDSLMRFKSFREKPLDEQIVLQKFDFKKWNGRGRLNDDLNSYYEDISPSQKKSLMKDLIKKLQNKDWWYFMSDDGRSYDRGKKEDQIIHDLMLKIGGSEPKKLYKKYGRKAGVLEDKNVFEWMELKCTNRVQSFELLENEDRLDINLSLSGDALHKILNDVQDSEYKDKKNGKRTKKEKDEDDELVDVKPKIKEVIDKRIRGLNRQRTI